MPPTDPQLSFTLINSAVQIFSCIRSKTEIRYAYTILYCVIIKRLRTKLNYPEQSADADFHKIRKGNRKTSDKNMNSIAS